MNIRILFNWLIPPLNSLEKKLLSAVASHLAPDAQSLFKKQIEQINFVQRHALNKEVNLYCMRNGKAFYDKCLRFPFDQEEVKLSSILISNTDNHTKYDVAIWLIKGFLFSIEFSYSPKGLIADQVEIINVKLLVDPMRPAKTKHKDSVNINALQGWILALAVKWHVTDLKEPLPKTEREDVISKLAIKLPSDYLELVTQTEGMKLDGCCILGLSEIRDLLMERSNYYVLAEIEGKGVLALRQNSGDTEIKFIGFEEDDEVGLGSSFRYALERMITA